jgi:flavin-dependent dehydrogenase
VPEICIVDKATFPRFKLCGGGLTRHAQKLLTNLGGIELIRSREVNRVEVLVPCRSISITRRNILRIVSREELDYTLLRRVEHQGITVRQRESVYDFTRDQDSILLRTSKGYVRSKIVVAADGANSNIRRQLLRGCYRKTMVALEAPARTDEFTDRPDDGTAVFDFRPLRTDFWGYYWEFPGWSQGYPKLHAGIADTRLAPSQRPASLRQILIKHAANRGLHLDLRTFRGHSVPCFDLDSPQSAPNFLLVGDAAGTDPLWGEGITSALRLGQAAAESIEDALRTNDFSFSHYDSDLRREWIGRSVSARSVAARRFYGSGGRLRYLALDWATQLLLRSFT